MSLGNEFRDSKGSGSEGQPGHRADRVLVRAMRVDRRPSSAYIGHEQDVVARWQRATKVDLNQCVLANRMPSRTCTIAC